MARRVVAVVVAFVLLVGLSLTASWRLGDWFYSPPTGGELFAVTGKLTILQRKELQVEKEEFVRDLTEQETTALRYFIQQADYIEYPTLYTDFTYVPVVHVDGIRWWVYRSSLFRVEGGDVKWRKTIPDFTFTSPSDRHEIDFTALLAWHESQQ